MSEENNKQEDGGSDDVGSLPQQDAPIEDGVAQVDADQGSSDFGSVAADVSAGFGNAGNAEAGDDGGREANAGEADRQADADQPVGDPCDDADDSNDIDEEKILHTVTFDLTEQEFANKGKEAAALQSEISALNCQFDAAKRTHKAETGLREEKVSVLLGTIRRGKEEREVECIKVLDYAVGLVRIFHQFRMVEERVMQGHERQRKLVK